MPSVCISTLYCLPGVKSWIKSLVSLRVKFIVLSSVFQTGEEKTESQSSGWCSGGSQGSKSERENISWLVHRISSPLCLKKTLYTAVCSSLTTGCGEDEIQFTIQSCSRMSGIFQLVPLLGAWQSYSLAFWELLGLEPQSSAGCFSRSDCGNSVLVGTNSHVGFHTINAAHTPSQ